MAPELSSQGHTRPWLLDSTLLATAAFQAFALLGSLQDTRPNTDSEGWSCTLYNTNLFDPGCVL